MNIRRRAGNWGAAGWAEEDTGAETGFESEAARETKPMRHDSTNLLGLSQFQWREVLPRRWAARNEHATAGRGRTVAPFTRQCPPRLCCRGERAAGVSALRFGSSEAYSGDICEELRETADMARRRIKCIKMHFSGMRGDPGTRNGRLAWKQIPMERGADTAADGEILKRRIRTIRFDRWLEQGGM